MTSAPRDLAQVRLDNALRLFDEFVQATIKHPDAATLRGLEGRFAERLQIQPSYWSQIKGRSRQIGERLARQFERLCHKPNGWMDQPHGAVAPDVAAPAASVRAASPSKPGEERPDAYNVPQDDDERFIVGLVLTYYRRHPQRARTRLLDLLGEVLAPVAPAAPAPSRRQGPCLGRRRARTLEPHPGRRGAVEAKAMSGEYSPRNSRPHPLQSAPVRLSSAQVVASLNASLQRHPDSPPTRKQHVPSRPVDHCTDELPRCGSRACLGRCDGERGCAARIAATLKRLH